jgi:hypothetical protein
LLRQNVPFSRSDQSVEGRRLSANFSRLGRRFPRPSFLPTISAAVFFANVFRGRHFCRRFPRPSFLPTFSVAADLAAVWSVFEET